MEIIFVPLALAPIIMILAIPLVFVLLIWKMLSRRRPAPLTSDEILQLQRMWCMLDRMEQRVANLEAILKDREAEVPSELKR